MVGDKKRRVWEKETIHWRCQQASGPTEISGWIYSLSKMSPHETLLKGFSWCGLVNGQEKGKEKMISEHFGSRRQEEPRTGRASQKSVSLPGEQMRGKSVLRNPERNWHLCAPSSGCRAVMTSQEQILQEVEKCASWVLRVIKRQVWRAGRKPQQSQSVKSSL